MKKTLKILLLIAGLLTTPIVFSAAIFNITTADPFITILPNETVNITYTIQNTSGTTLSKIKYFPPAGTTINAVGTTCSTTLANNASCTLVLTFHAPSTSGTIVLNPLKVCAFNGQICAQSNAANQIHIQITTQAFTVTRNTSDSLQYQSLNVQNNSSSPVAVDVSFPANLLDRVQLCNPDNDACFHQSTCTVNTPIPSGTSCELWFRSLDNADISLGSETGVIEIIATNGQTYPFTATSRMDLYAGGNFAEAGGIPVNSLARWDGNTWSSVSFPSAGFVFSLIVYQGNLYAGGAFTNAISSWNGTNWSTVGGGITGNRVGAMTIYDGDLYVGGLFDTAGGVTANNIASWNGSSWSAAVGTGTDGIINSMAVDSVSVGGPILYLGGSFTTANGVPASNIASWDGTNASALSTGTDGEVFSLITVLSELYVGGSFANAGNTLVNFITEWIGGAFISLDGGMNDSVFAILNFDNTLYAGGAFTQAGGEAVGMIASGLNWAPLTGGGMNNSVNALTTQNDLLYAGGAFTTAGGNSASLIASWNGSVWSPLGSGLTPNTGLALTLLPASSLTWN